MQTLREIVGWLLCVVGLHNNQKAPTSTYRYCARCGLVSYD